MSASGTPGATESRRPVLVLGNGGFGTALALVLEASGHPVRVWGHEAAATREIESRRENRRFLPGVRLPPAIRFSPEISELVPDVRTVFSVVPSQFLRGALTRLAPRLPAEGIVVSCSKGFERDTAERPSRIIAAALPRARLAVLGGPSHAEEIAQGLPTTVVVASEDAETAREVRDLFTLASFRAYTGRDPLGVELAGATKNVMAIAAGISDGLGYGDNARAALVCRGAAEMARLGAALGARPTTFAGLSGIGDLVATCTSDHSRNRTLGRRVATGESLDEILGSVRTVAEGVETARSVRQRAAARGVEVPITEEVCRVLFEGKDPRAAVADLMSREPKEES